MNAACGRISLHSAWKLIQRANQKPQIICLRLFIAKKIASHPSKSFRPSIPCAIHFSDTPPNNNKFVDDVPGFRRRSYCAGNAIGVKTAYSAPDPASIDCLNFSAMPGNFSKPGHARPLHPSILYQTCASNQVARRWPATAELRPSAFSNLCAHVERRTMP